MEKKKITSHVFCLWISSLSLYISFGSTTYSSLHHIRAVAICDASITCIVGWEAISACSLAWYIQIGYLYLLMLILIDLVILHIVPDSHHRAIGLLLLQLLLL